MYEDDETPGYALPPETPAPRFATFETLTAVDAVTVTEDVELEDGSLVRVRGLTRYEIQLHGKGDPDSTTVEARNLAACIVEPKLSVEQVKAWSARCAAGGDVATVSRRIHDLSGLGERADKSNV